MWLGVSASHACHGDPPVFQGYLPLAWPQEWPRPRAHSQIPSHLHAHNKCGSQTVPGQPGEPGSISKLDPRHPGPTSKESRGSAAGALASLASP